MFFFSATNLGVRTAYRHQTQLHFRGGLPTPKM